MFRKDRVRDRWVFVLLGVFAPKIFGVVAKKKVRFGIISNTKMNATKALRLKGSQSSVF
jgi:hypothetical protein